jgi:type IV pilus assembly protein PilO
LVIVVVLAAGWFLFLSPTRADIADTTTQIDDARTQLSAAQAKLAQAEATRAEGKANQARLIELAKMVPTSDEMASLLIQIQDLASQSGITFMSITPAEPLEGDGYSMIPLEVKFSGTYFDLSDFVYRAEQMVAAPGRLLAVKSLKLELLQGGAAATLGSASGSPTLNVSITMYAFETAAAAGSQPATPAAPAGADTTSSTAGNM